MDRLFEQVLRSPRLGQLHHRIDAVMQAERARREAFRDHLSEDEKAEFINGDVVVHSPVRWAHNLATGTLYSLMLAHVRLNDLGAVGVEKTLVALTRNDYEPDVCFWRKTVADAFTPDQEVFPAPDFVAEVLSPSTRENDLVLKMEDYAAHGITEYWVIDPEARTVAQYIAEDDVYQLRLLSDSGVVRSVAVPSFVLPIPALFDREAYREALRSLTQNG